MTELDAIIAKVETLRGACDDVLRVLRDSPSPVQVAVLGEWIRGQLVATAKSRFGRALAERVWRRN